MRSPVLKEQTAVSNTSIKLDLDPNGAWVVQE